MDSNISDLKVKAENSNKIQDKLTYIYYGILPEIEKYDIFINDIFQDVKEELQKLLNDTKLSKNMSKKNFNSYINCKEKLIYIQQLLLKYEKYLSSKELTVISKNVDLSKVLVLAHLTQIQDNVQKMVEFIDRESRKIQNN